MYNSSMFINSTEVNAMLTPYRAAVAVSGAVYRLSRKFGSLFILPTVDHLYGNACEWERWFTEDPFAKELIGVVTDLLISLPFLLGVYCRQQMDGYVNQCLQPIEKVTEEAVNTLADEPETVVNTTVEPDPVLETTVNTFVAIAHTFTQPETPDYSQLTLVQLRKIASEKKMPKAMRSNKEAILKFLAA